MTTQFRVLIIGDSSTELPLFDSQTLCFVDVNKQAQSNLGFSMEELRCMTPADIQPQYTNELLTELIEPLRTGQQPELMRTAITSRNW